jgi:hypothetical protein
MGTDKNPKRLSTSILEAFIRVIRAIRGWIPELL